MNKLGHVENYTFSIELETAYTVVLNEAYNLTLPQMVLFNSIRLVLSHSDFDNYDQLVNLSGSVSVHTSHLLN